MTSESGFVAMMRAIAVHPAARGLADDAAVIEVGDEALVLTHDMMVAGLHWLDDADPANVAAKLVAVNLSDLAAKGARPIGVLLGFMLGADDWDRRFADGLAAALRGYDVALLGGDTVGGGAVGPRAIGMTAIGVATYCPVPSRAGAQAGDALWLCGAVGDAMAGHDLARTGGSDPVLLGAFNRPRPMLAEGQRLAPVATAMMDVSDGLLLDAWRMAEASGLMVAIDSALVPVSDALAGYLAAMPAAEVAEKMSARLRWGDDYALLFAARDGLVPPVAATRIGTFSDRLPSRLMLDGAAIADDDTLGYVHAAERSVF